MDGIRNNEIKELQVKPDQIKSSLDVEQQKLFSLGSVQNYLNFYGRIKYYGDDVLIFRGILADLLLLISGLLQQVYYIPIATLLLLIYWNILKLHYEKRGRIVNTGY